LLLWSSTLLPGFLNANVVNYLVALVVVSASFGRFAVGLRALRAPLLVIRLLFLVLKPHA